MTKNKLFCNFTSKTLNNPFQKTPFALKKNYPLDREISRGKEKECEKKVRDANDILTYTTFLCRGRERAMRGRREKVRRSLRSSASFLFRPSNRIPCLYGRMIIKLFSIC